MIIPLRGSQRCGSFTTNSQGFLEHPSPQPPFFLKRCATREPVLTGSFFFCLALVSSFCTWWVSLSVLLSSGNVWLSEIYSASIVPEVDWVQWLSVPCSWIFQGRNLQWRSFQQRRHLWILLLWFNDTFEEIRVPTGLRRAGKWLLHYYSKWIPYFPVFFFLCSRSVFGLKLKGERALLTAPNGITIVDSIRFMGSDGELTYGRWVWFATFWN